MSEPYVRDADFTLYVGDVIEELAGLQDDSIHCVVTSPPYWGLRDYGTGEWEGGDPACNHRVGNQVADRKAAGAIVAGVRPGIDASVCRDCGACRLDKQIGLEATPEEYVARIVDVFREVRRVLRPDGTCWLNLGDSYSSNPKGSSGATNTLTPSGARVQAEQHRTAGLVAGLKAKDLVGVPWRVARALQEPYYTGKIKDERDRIWLAAMIDAEGCIYIHKRKAGTDSHAKFTRKDGTKTSYARTQDTYGSGLEISNTSREIVERVFAIVGGGSISTSTRGRNQPLHRWTLRTSECRDVLREVYPHLVAKQHQARLAIGCPSSGEEAAAAHSSLISLHSGHAAVTDFPAPESLFEPGWYLRSDIIWSKSNPMPESVTDRPTNAHEYLFLLAKSARYFYDADAIREPHSPDGRKKTTHDHRVDNSHENYANMATDQERWPNGGRNRRTVWSIATESYRDAHFATFPQALVEPCIKAGTSEHGCCSSCGTPWARDVDVTYERADGGTSGKRRDGDEPDSNDRGMNAGTPVLNKIVKTVGWYPLCTCGGADLRPIYSPLGEDGGYDPTSETGRAGFDRPRAETAGTRRTTRHEQAGYAKQLRKSPARPEMEEQAGDAFKHYIRTDGSGARPIPEMFLEWWIGRGWLTRVEVPSTDAWPAVVPCTVLDPFMGSGTTARVARRLGRHSVGIDLNEEYASIAAKRLGQQSLFALTDDAPCDNVRDEVVK